MTTAVYDGNLTEGEHRGHNGADVKCENQTSTITLPDRSEPYEHTAMLRRGIDAVNNHPKNLNIRNKGVREIQRPDETPIMDNYDDFWDPTEMTLTSDGVDGSALHYWTAVLPSSDITHMGHCEGWTSNTRTPAGMGPDLDSMRGRANHTNEKRFSDSALACRIESHLLCASY